MYTKLKGLVVGLVAAAMSVMLAVAGSCEEVPVTLDTLITSVQADVSGNIFKVAGPAFVIFGSLLAIGLLWRWIKKATRAS